MFKAIATTFGNCFKIPELKSRIFFTLAVLAICRLEAVVRIPGLDGSALAAFFDSKKGDSGSAFGMYSLFTGGAMEHCAVGALGIMPYISATIILQLLTAVVGRLSKLAREEGGRVKLVKLGRYVTVGLCLVQGFAMALGWEHPEKLFGNGIGQLVMGYPGHWIWVYRIETMLILTTGTMLLMWLGEQITDRGIGNGVSLIITIGILARLPQAAVALKDMFAPAGGDAQYNYGIALALFLLLVAVIAGVIAITQAQRKIPVQYAQRAVGRKVFAGGTSFMPLRVNYAGVMPIIFAQAILMFPQKTFEVIGGVFLSTAPGQTVSASGKFIGQGCMSIARILGYGGATYLIIYSLMILFFSYFWVATQFNELQISDDLKKNGGYVPGVRPGQATCDYLHNAMSRITLAGAVFLTVIAVVPIILQSWMGVPNAVSSFFGGTSILITVGVLLDTMRQMESHLMMRHYDGFLKKGRLHGRF
jgi:preprotein translocase subunit SecY